MGEASRCRTRHEGVFEPLVCDPTTRKIKDDVDTVCIAVLYRLSYIGNLSDIAETCKLGITYYSKLATTLAAKDKISSSNNPNVIFMKRRSKRKKGRLSIHIRCLGPARMFGSARLSPLEKSSADNPLGRHVAGPNGLACDRGKRPPRYRWPISGIDQQDRNKGLQNANLQLQGCPNSKHFFTLPSLMNPRILIPKNNLLALDVDDATVAIKTKCTTEKK